MKFCGNISFMFGEATSIIERYALAKNAGFKAVESAFPSGFTLEQVKQAKENAGVEQVLINLKADEESPVVTAIPGKENEFKTAFATTIQYAKAVNAKKVHIMAGTIEKPTESNWVTYENNLKYAAGVLRTENLVGLIEPINHYSVPNYFLSDFGRAVEIIKRIDSPHLRLMLDIFHLQQIQGDLSHAITKFMPYVGHVQVIKSTEKKSNVSKVCDGTYFAFTSNIVLILFIREVLMSFTKRYATANIIAQVPHRNEPNTPGEINYEYVLKHLATSGYDDWVGLEYKPLGATQDGLGWINKFGYSL